MDYLEAELEAKIFPSVDLDPRDWEQEEEPYIPDDDDSEEEYPYPAGWEEID